MAFPRFLSFALGLALAWPALSAGKERESFPPAEIPARLEPQASLVAYAQAHQVALEGIELADAAAQARPGDEITAIATLRDGKDTKQWLVQLRVGTPTAKELKDSPAADFTLTVQGRTFTYAADRVLALESKTVGPFVPGKKSPGTEKRARTLIQEDLLALGLDRGCEAMLKAVNDPAEAKPGERKFNDDELRTVVGMVPALVTFVQGVQGTPGLREILWDVMDKPSAWSVVKRGGKISLGINLARQSGEVAPMQPGEWPQPAVPLFRFGIGLSINDQPALVLSFVVGPARPPLLTTAGVVGILAKPPTGEGKRLDLQLVSSRRGAVSTALPQ